MKTAKTTKHEISLLFVEDGKAAREALRLMIHMKYPDMPIYAAEGGITGYKLFKKHKPDIVITDINMPSMNGIEMAGKIKMLKADTKLIVLTGYGDRKNVDDFKKIGFHDYILKPIEFKTLFSKIEKCIEELTM